jgi:uncharacterized membrane protein YuzA (DUF378 family)
MIKTIEKNWFIITVLFLLIIMAALLLRPSIAQTLSYVIIGLGTVMLSVFAVRKNHQYRQQGRISRMDFLRNVILEVLGIVGAVVAAAWLAGQAMSRIIAVVYAAAESARPGSGSAAGMITGIIVALCAGMGVGLVIHWIMGRLTRKIR